MANWLMVKMNGNKLGLPVGGGLYDVLEFGGNRPDGLIEGIGMSIQKYGNSCARGGLFWGSVLALGGVAVYGLWKKHKQKKEEESEEQEDGA